MYDDFEASLRDCLTSHAQDAELANLQRAVQQRSRQLNHRRRAVVLSATPVAAALALVSVKAASSAPPTIATAGAAASPAAAPSAPAVAPTVTSASATSSTAAAVIGAPTRTETVSVSSGRLQVQVPDCPSGTTPDVSVDRVQGPSFPAHVKPNQLYVRTTTDFYLDGSSDMSLAAADQPTFTLGWTGSGAPDMSIVEPAGHPYPYTDDGSPVAAHYVGCLMTQPTPTVPTTGPEAGCVPSVGGSTFCDNPSDDQIVALLGRLPVLPTLPQGWSATPHRTLNYDPTKRVWVLQDTWSQGGPDKASDLSLPQVTLTVSPQRAGDPVAKGTVDAVSVALSGGVTAYGFLPEAGLPEGHQEGDLEWVRGGFSFGVTTHLLGEPDLLRLANGSI